MDKSKQLQVQAPGRINLIGEHTDYNDGFVMPAAVDKKITVQVRENGNPTHCLVTAGNLGESFEFDLGKLNPLKSGWQNYILGVVYELQQLGAPLRGFTAHFEGDVPVGGGMSSSAALECGLALALNELFDLGLEKIQLIKACQLAEHNFVGIKCGIMDQFASVMGKKGHALLLDCRSLAHRYYPLELGEYELLLLNTNVSHTLASSEYNTRRAECETGVVLLQRYFPEITHLRDLTLEQLNQHREQLPEPVFRRCLHVISENQRVLDATSALAAGNLPVLGRLLYQSHFSLQRDYEVSCPELDFLVEQTLERNYVLGSRMMGGGFGGCTLNIIEKNRRAEFVETASQAYRQRFGIDPTPYSVSIEDGATIVH